MAVFVVKIFSPLIFYTTWPTCHSPRHWSLCNQSSTAVVILTKTSKQFLNFSIHWLLFLVPSELNTPIYICMMVMPLICHLNVRVDCSLLTVKRLSRYDPNACCSLILHSVTPAATCISTTFNYIIITLSSFLMPCLGNPLIQSQPTWACTTRLVNLNVLWVRVKGQRSNTRIINLEPSSLLQNGWRRSEDGLGNCVHIPGAVTSHSQNLECPIKSSEIMALRNNYHDIIRLKRGYSSYLASHRPDSCVWGHCGTTWALRYATNITNVQCHVPQLRTYSYTMVMWGRLIMWLWYVILTSWNSDITAPGMWAQFPRSSSKRLQTFEEVGWVQTTAFLAKQVSRDRALLSHVTGPFLSHLSGPFPAMQ